MGKKNILFRTNALICLVIIVGFLITMVLSRQVNYSSAIENIEQVSALTSEGIYYQMNTAFAKPVNISLTMANDSLLKEFLSREPEHLEDPDYSGTIKQYLHTYQQKYGYDSVFLVSKSTSRYYNFNGLDRVLSREDPENAWYFDGMLNSNAEYSMNIDNDQVEGAQNAITVFVNCRIKDGSGDVLGIVGVGVRIDYLQDILQNYQNEFHVNACLIDDTGMIELSTEHTGYEKVNIFDHVDQQNEIRQNILNWKKEGVPLQFWKEGRAGQKQDYIVVRYIPDVDWHLVVERDTASLIQRLNEQLILTVAVIGAILMSILILITRVIHHFNQQIIALTKSMEQERSAVFEKTTEQLFENIYELDITHNRPANRTTEKYFESLGATHGTPFDRALHIIAEKQIKEEFRQGYIDMFLPGNVLRAYERGQDSLHYELMITRDGTHYYWMRITGRIVRWESDDTIHLLVYRQNIDAEKRQEAKMRMLARTDEMTGFLTKMATQRYIGEMLAENPRDAFVYFIFDIDNFKQANDQFGHAFGDTVIMMFSEIIRDHFHKEDIVGRIGGDEFAVFIQAESRAWVADKAAELCRALEWDHTWSGMCWHVSASIGMAFAPEHGRDAATLYENADAALYQTKKNGKNGYTLYGENTVHGKDRNN